MSHLVTMHTHPQPLSTGIRIGDKGPGGKNGQGYRDVLSLASLESGISPRGLMPPMAIHLATWICLGPAGWWVVGMRDELSLGLKAIGPWA